MGAAKISIWVIIGLIAVILLAGCSQATITGDESTSTATLQDRTELATPTSIANVVATPELKPSQNEVAEQATELPTEIPANEPITESVLLAGTDINKHSVPLDEVHFDTFDGSYVALSDANESTILSLRDAIPPIDAPQYESVEAANVWLRADDIVIGYVDGDEALAYPARIMNYHEIVNETINDVPVLISFCPLCDSGIVYDRRLNGQVLEFGNTSALHNSDMVMYDKQTFSYWFQVGGDAIVGDLTGQRLEVLPTRFMRWQQWKEAYPNSRVLSRDTGFSRPYDRDPFTGLPTYLNQGRFPFPVGDDARNPALPAGERIISVVINDKARAYPLEALTGVVVNDEVGDTPVTVVVDKTGTAEIFDRRLGDQTLTFNWNEDVLTDEETESQWALNGAAISGELEGEQLKIVPARFSFWFAFVAAFPEAEVYQP